MEKLALTREDIYRTVVENQTELICRFKPDGTITFINDAYCKYFEKTPQELIGHTFMPLIPKSDHIKVKKNFRAVSRKNPTFTHEHRVVLPDGEIRWQRWTNKAIFDSSGKLAEYQAVGQDITERKLAEEALRDKERFLSDIFSSIQDGISILDKDMKIVRVNSIMEKWYSHAIPLVGKKCYAAYHGRKTPCEVCPSQRTLKNGRAAYEVVPKRAGKGKVVGWLDLYSFPLIDTASGKLKGVIEYVRDITKRKETEGKLEELNRELTRSNKKLKHLALKDSQTGLYNHRYLEEVIEAEFLRSRREAHPVSVLMMDIDYFKSINDVYGHKFGDMVLQQFARYLKSLMRRYDIIVRFGGEEFVVVSSGVTRSDALVMAERLLSAINLYNFGNEKHTVKIKLSIAVVSYPEDRVSRGMEMLDLADKILNKVKEKGGNKIYSSGEMQKSPVAPGVYETKPNIKFLKDKINKLTKRGNQSLAEAIFAFAKTIELKDHYTGEHGEQTVHYAIEIAKALNLPQEEIDYLREASILHDLGKIGISDKILRKKSALTKKEFAEIMRHPQIGVDIIRPIQFLHDIIPYMLYHHERWDGKGYPIGLKGEEIPVGARIIAIADAYQALTSDRPYRKAYSKKRANQIIRKGAGTHFDPNIVSLFLNILEGNNKKRGNGKK